MDPVVRGVAPAPQVDIVSGATVTVLVMGDSVVRSATKLIKSGRLGARAMRRPEPRLKLPKRLIPARARSAIGKAWLVTAPFAA